MGVTRFNALPAGDAERELLSCCASPAWAREVAAGRPYPDVDTLAVAAGAALDRLGWEQVEAALAAHPRIGEPPDGAGREAAWSRREQAAVATAGRTARAALAAANRAYEERFGHIFLIFASGRTDAEILAAATERLGNDAETERGVVRGELGKIARLRLERLLA
ncbi:MAG TPA: 2-oxo-4-hydroxy-4-carboxy-5-ureidoimidazoline decarboxylase [Micromonosporaceae bacterium]|nr:2-oxo-4-hydroxy-4-carboxy-5-ureidoimidazoline decarboxylase [Micromonosporaceae bacterium]